MTNLNVKFKNLNFKNPVIMASGTFGFGKAIAFAIVLVFIYLLFRPYKESNTLNVNMKKASAK